MNAFTIPAQSRIQIRQPSTKQIKQDALRVNRYEPVCTKNDTVKTAKILRGGL